MIWIDIMLGGIINNGGLSKIQPIDFKTYNTKDKDERLPTVLFFVVTAKCPLLMVPGSIRMYQRCLKFLPIDDSIHHSHWTVAHCCQSFLCPLNCCFSLHHKWRPVLLMDRFLLSCFQSPDFYLSTLSLPFK